MPARAGRPDVIIARLALSPFRPQRQVGLGTSPCSRLTWVQVLHPEPALRPHGGKGLVRIPGVSRNVMKRLTGVLALLLVLVAAALASTDKQAKALYDKGKQAEARQDYISAYNYYHQAYPLKPTDLTYRSAYEYVRFLAAAAYVHKGQLLLNSGKLQEALTDFEQALAVDPSSF